MFFINGKRYWADQARIAYREGMIQVTWVQRPVDGYGFRLKGKEDGCLQAGVMRDFVRLRMCQRADVRGVRGGCCWATYRNGTVLLLPAMLKGAMKHRASGPSKSRVSMCYMKWGCNAKTRFVVVDARSVTHTVTAAVKGEGEDAGTNASNMQRLLLVDTQG